jgi:hypothetical protein
MEISSDATNRNPAAPVAAGRQASETIDKNNTMGSAQSRTSVCVKDQPRRTLPAEPMGTFMSELSFFRLRPSLGRRLPQCTCRAMRRCQVEKNLSLYEISVNSAVLRGRGHLGEGPSLWGDWGESLQ